MKQSEICLEDSRYTPYLDHGFVALIEHMGSDESIEFSARMSYGDGTRTVNDRRNLIRYLVRNSHTSPLEMGELRFHLKMPITVARQHARHRTASCNELSQRYSYAPGEVYIPSLGRVAKQSTTNKQCSGELLDESIQETAIESFKFNASESNGIYNGLIDLGVSRELARGVLPVHGYTEMVWKIDLKNFLHYYTLRKHHHAQKEIQILAELMYSKVKEHFPITCEAWEDYHINSVKFSKDEMVFIMEAVNAYGVNLLGDRIRHSSNMSKREISELFEKLGVKDGV